LRLAISISIAAVREAARFSDTIGTKSGIAMPRLASAPDRTSRRQV
jgi:hypothetical protein